MKKELVSTRNCFRYFPLSYAICSHNEEMVNVIMKHLNEHSPLSLEEEEQIYDDVVERVLVGELCFELSNMLEKHLNSFPELKSAVRQN